MSGPAIRPRRRELIASLGAALALVTALSGCTVLEPSVPERPVVSENLTEPEQVPEFVPGGTAEENLPFFTEVLRGFAVGTMPVEGQPLVDSLITAGFDRSLMQVSFDRSKTNLVADSILVSVLAGTGCLIGQVNSADRTFVAVVEPALTAAQNVCLIGNTRPIDW